MPEQAILDLPVIEFEHFQDSPGRLHAQCIESYELTGFRPHPDAVFHLAASLWRYRRNHSLKQVAALAALFLDALSRHVAARRRVAAVRTAMDEPGASALRGTLAEADDELAAAQDELSGVTGRLTEFVAGYFELRERDPAAAGEILAGSLEEMGEPGWIDRLEILAQELRRLEDPRIDWSAPLAEVLADLDALKLPGPSNGNGHSTDGGLLRRLQSEIEQYRVLAGRASKRLQQVDAERHQLEDLLQDSEQNFGSRARAIEEARHALEVTLADVRARMQRMEDAHGSELQQARREIAALRAERDRLAEELLAALETSTETESSQEELIEQIESAAGDRAEAAGALSALSRRLEEVQGDAETAAGRASELQARVDELEAILDEMRDELSRSEERVLQAEATIEALESDAGRSTEFEAILTESEERLTATEEQLADALLRADQLGGQLEDKSYELQRAQERIEAQKRTVDSISSQLAETETLADEQDARIAGLERENERLRRDLSHAQSKMLDAAGDVDEAREAAETARLELQHLKEQFEEQKGRTSTVNSESLALRANLRERDEEVVSLRAELLDAQQRAKKAEKQAEDGARRGRDLEDEPAALRQEAAAARAEADKLRADLKAARDEAAARRSEAEGLSRDAGARQDELERLRAELDAMRNAADLGGSRKAETRARVIELEQQLAQQREEAQAESDLARERHARLQERLQLAQARAANADLERQSLLESLEQLEGTRQAERAELQALVETERGRVSSDETALLQATSELEALREKLNDSEAYLIKRQREFERVEAQLRGLLEEIRAVADLRTEYESGEPGKARDEIASQIARRTDSLFASAGKPVRADRRTEKLVILTVKKSDEEIAAESDKPFVATNKRADRNDPKPSES
jgi:chromosome segregation ATPase